MGFSRSLLPAPPHPVPQNVTWSLGALHKVLVKVKSLGQALTQRNWCLYEGKFGQMNKHTGRTSRKDKAEPGEMLLYPGEAKTASRPPGARGEAWNHLPQTLRRTDTFPQTSSLQT